jgi:hypothetical protein
MEIADVDGTPGVGPAWTLAAGFLVGHFLEHVEGLIAALEGHGLDRVGTRTGARFCTPR